MVAATEHSFLLQVLSFIDEDFPRGIASIVQEDDCSFREILLPSIKAHLAHQKWAKSRSLLMKQTFLDEYSTSVSISDLLTTSNSTLLAVRASYDIKSRQDVAVANHQQRVAKRVK